MNPYLQANLIGDLFNLFLFIGAGGAAALWKWRSMRKVSVVTASSESTKAQATEILAQRLRLAVMDLEALNKGEVVEHGVTQRDRPGDVFFTHDMERRVTFQVLERRVADAYRALCIHVNSYNVAIPTPQFPKELLMRCYFFGYEHHSGHVLQGNDRNCLPDRNERERIQHCGTGEARIHIDGSLVPKRNRDGSISFGAQFKTRRDQERHFYGSGGTVVQGEFLIHHLDNGFTAMSWWDSNQGDSRPGCNSNVLLEGKHDAATMLAALKEHFPHVLANLQKAGITLVDVTPPAAPPPA